MCAMNQEGDSQSAKRVIEGLPSNAFRVVGVGQDIILESFYLFPDFRTINESGSTGFNLEPDKEDEPNLRLVMSRDVAVRLTNALAQTLQGQVQLAQQQQQQSVEVSESKPETKEKKEAQAKR